MKYIELTKNDKIKTKSPAVMFSRRGYLYINDVATRFLKGQEKDVWVKLLYDPRNQKIILRRVAGQPGKKPPAIKKLIPQGVNKTSSAISFILASKAWGIPMDGRKIEVEGKGGEIIISL